MKKFILLLFLFFPAVLLAQNVSGRLGSSFYTFSRAGSEDVSKLNLMTFQSVYLNVTKSQFSLKTRLNLQTNSANTLAEERLRVYNLYFEARNILDVATIQAGRLPVFNRIAGGLVDGLNLKVKTSDIIVSGFGGGNIPAYQKFNFMQNLQDNYIFGGKITTTALQDFRFSVGYVNKNYKSPDYYSTRLDDELNPIEVLISNNSLKYQYVSGEANYNLKNITNVNVKYDFDINLEKTSKFEASGRYDQIENLGISLYYNYREPRVRYNSIFSVFDYGNTQEIEGGVDYKVIPEVTALCKVANVTYKGDNSQRITVGALTQYGSLTYRKNMGYSGEMDAVSVSGSYALLDGVLTPSLGLAFTNYKLSEDAETNNITSVLAGCNIRAKRYLSFDVQGQYFNNKIYSNDMRLLFKINYWFNSNLNLL